MKNFDNSFLSDTVKIIAGVDEAGRGPLAGPVVAAAVIFDNFTIIEGVNDSKQLTKAEREELFPQIIDKCLSYAVYASSHKVVDKINILQASLLAMKCSVDKLKFHPDLVLIDGNKCFISNYNTIPVIQGDSKSFAIASASILAKVIRDRIMTNLSSKHPGYLWEKNKGYATSEHIEAIKNIGPCFFHRKTFLKRILEPTDVAPQLEFEVEVPYEE